MVLYKRKQVTFIRAPEVPGDLNTEVFHIPATKEWFLTYEDYLQRMDYYHRKKFVCEITGNSCLTFFQATESEAKEIQEVEKNFPEALKEHILRFLQFNRITRLDQLVDKVYSVFKNDYFPGETIILKGSILNGQAESGTRQRGTIKEKIQYSNPSDGLLTKYLVVRANDQKQAIVINEKISRDRNHFTKWLIKAFIKLTMTRSHKVGAPWVVKNKFAKKYRINQKYPDDLVHFQSSTPSGDIIYEGDELPSAVADAPNGYRKLIKKSAAPSSKNLKKKAALNSILDEPPPVTAQEDDIKRRLPPHHMPDILSEADEEINKSSPQPAYPTSKKSTVSDLNLKFNLQYSKPIPEVLNVPENAKSWNGHLIQKHKEEQKTDERLDPELGSEIKRLGIRSVKSIQDALESWVFLNVYHTVLKLDTFTFDDFIYAMGWTHDQFEKIGRCELLDEIWCAVLGAIVSNEAPKNKSLKLDSDVIYGLQITLPPENSYINSPSKDDNDVGIEERGSDSDNEENILKSEDEADNDESHESLEMTNGNKDDAKIKTEQGVKLDDENDGDDEEEEEEEEDNDENNENGDSLNEDDDREHNAYIVMNYRNIPWHERLRKRNFRDGNWQCILLGVLSLVEYVPAFKPIINKVYRILAPVDMPATTSTVMNQFYDDLDIDLRLQVLNILVSLLMNGTQVRNYIDECLDSSTVLRRNRLDNIRGYKVAYDLAQKLHVEIHEKLTDAKEATENAKSKSKSKSKNKSKGKDSQSTPNPDSNKRRMPRLNLQAFEMSEQESKLAESDKGFKDLCDQRKETLLSIEKYKQAKRQLEKQLNEIDCQRVKLLGKDRLYNRYWWFENNGLPTLHSNTNDVDDNDDDDDNAAPNMNNDEDDEIVEDENAVLDETYLMGKLWVQGPSDDDLRIHFGSSLEDVDKYYNLYLNYEQELEKFYKCNNDQGESGEDSKQSIKEPFKQMDFNKLPLGFRSMSSEMFGLSFESNQVTRTLEDSIEKDIVIDHLGGLSVTSLTNYLTPLQRKILEENPDPLFSGSYWRFYDKPEQVTKLIEWLNPWGERESSLRKELLIVKEAIVQSMAARRKALSLDQQEAKELELENNIRQITEKLKSLGKDVNSLSNLNEEDVGKDDTEENDDENDEDEDELRVGRNKRLRNQPLPTKRQKTKSFSDVIGSDNVNALSKVYTDLLNELQESKEEKELSRVLEWVNSKAIDKFDRSLYEGGDRSKTKTKSNK